MHSAPSVNYPVGRSAFVGWLYIAFASLGALAVVAWLFQSSFGWRQALALVAVLASSGLALLGWHRSQVGVLRWDGESWAWERGGVVAFGRPEIALDLQSRLLLRWRPDSGRVRWFWLERSSDASHWDTLRRAVYSRASTHVPAAGEPPAASQ
jgi:toxin CptA